MGSTKPIGSTNSPPSSTKRPLSLRLWESSGTLLINLLALFLIFLYLFPLVYMITTALKGSNQLQDFKSPVWPGKAVTFNYEDKDHAVFYVPTATGIEQWALITKRRNESFFIDPAHPEKGLITWEGQWRTLDPVYQFQLVFSNFNTLLQRVDYPKLIKNTLFVAVVSGVGVLFSSITVAYGFARFPIPGKRFLFILLIGTIIIPEKVTLIPTYYTFVRILEWNGTLLPLIVPHFFGNAVLIFLLYQNFKSIPQDMEEAAMIDGAGPIRMLISIILPQSMPVITTVAMLHFFYAWNESRNAALYLSISADLHTVGFGIQRFQSYFPTVNFIQASILIVMGVPILVLFLAQNLFMRNVLVTGVEK